MLFKIIKYDVKNIFCKKGFLIVIFLLLTLIFFNIFFPCISIFLSKDNSINSILIVNEIITLFSLIGSVVSLFSLQLFEKINVNHFDLTLILSKNITRNQYFLSKLIICIIVSLVISLVSLLFNYFSIMIYHHAINDSNIWNLVDKYMKLWNYFITTFAISVVTVLATISLSVFKYGKIGYFINVILIIVYNVINLLLSKQLDVELIYKLTFYIPLIIYSVMFIFWIVIGFILINKCDITI